MGKALTVILVIAFVFSACLSACAAKEEPETGLDVVAHTPAVAPEPEPEPVPDEPAPGLMNFMDWLKLHPEEVPEFNIEADWLIFSNPRDDGYVTSAVLYPRQWPSKQLGDSIPEYTGTGYMQEFFITHPGMSSRTEDIERIRISIYEYEDEDIEDYISSLSDFTPNEEPADEYSLDGNESAPYIKSVQSFVKDGVTLNIVFAEEDESVVQFLNSGKFLQFEVIYAREAYVFDPDAAEPTELLNFFEFADEMNFEVPAEMSLDYLMDTYDGSGMHYELVSAPSKWPREAFCDLLPAYTGFGFMQKYEITTPQDDTSLGNALVFSLYITTDNLADIEAYIRRVADFGYYELAPEEYREHEKNMLDERDLVRVFSFPGYTCVISSFVDIDLPTLDITLVFEGRHKNFISGQASNEEEGAA